MLKSILAASSLVSLVSAHAASLLAVATIKAQFQNSLLTADVPALSNFDPTGLFAVGYGSNTSLPNGVEVQIADVQTAPALKIRGTSVSENNATCKASAKQLVAKADLASSRFL